ncbi:3 beta-hydroxysteroid dehydrogenase/Delta 5--_4-isomerase [Enhygromyxa salina]|uniref:3 beta-hydroxysteroid dehydrogenase/Delta 5-->4-isomerase n=1 Tax=Enhygromyxa salina TaxID=215803 RepID=A0A2S9Y4K0_9BACT|nr:NAD-dependent epimerase/dehydratase family protein [Enhygromyxa salina]PRQ00027.1 3 beta-hydroxysteroid dehydrogenase/Delta 5-->4-isomerase [Enhygromyxa salina]
MPVVVTGASGHLGANLVRALLARGERVRVLVHRSSSALREIEDQLERVDGSVCEPDTLGPAFEGARRVYHLAGVISIDGDREGLVHRVNVEGTRNVARACVERGVERLVSVSSVHAYDMDPRDEVLDEGRRQVADSLAHSAYDRSKALGERAVRAAIDDGLDAVIVNPTGVMGPVDFGPSRLGQLLRDLADGRLPALLDGGFDFVDVRDVAAGVIAAGERGRCGHNYILGNAWYSIRELASLVEAAGGRRPPRLVSPAWAARMGVPFARVASRLTGREPMFTRESLDILDSNRSISSRKAQTELGHSPRPLAETVADTLAWQAAQAQAAS